MQRKAWIMYLLIAQALASAAEQDMNVSCDLILQKMKAYLDRHGMATSDQPLNRDGMPPTYAMAGGRRELLDATGRRIVMNRFGVSPYVAQGSMSPLRIYTEFKFYGRLTLAPTSGGCHLQLILNFYAYRWSAWLVAEGDPLKFESERLEKEYLAGVQSN